ncbi:Retrovirus-related Pol polyprotein from transposon RE1 [Vitis vinifera]|uniref:Retrovirus-related Pol polyprotein from transposon RE1 n=1 Tax=Vitis vinifera TaxID=29760 RepID=A0A438CZY8_VITVI|nr:Retrovirus-related Pol polyprotein from transposon RE1 [Vitis vinifera]
MHSEFKMSMMGELNFFLGLQIKQLKKGTFINQAKYIRDLLKRFNMEEAKTMKTPMSSSIKLDMDEKGKSVNSTMYRGMIGSLLYLTASRPDIMYSVCLCARFQSCPKESHLSAVKRIHRYLKRTMDINLWYPKGDNFELIGYLNADFAGCKVERKSTSGTCHFLGHSFVSWHSKKQKSVALSTAEAEYIASGLCCAQILWMKQTLSDFNLIFEHVPIKCDNTSATFQKIRPFTSLLLEVSFGKISDRLQVVDLILGRLEGWFSFISVRLGLQVGVCSFLFEFILLLNFSFSLQFIGWLLCERQAPLGLRASALLSYLNLSRRRLVERRVVTISEPIFPTLVQTFYSRETYGLGGPVLSIVRGVEIRLSPESICRILDIPSVGLRVYEAKAWPTVSGFEPKEIV